MLLSDRLTFLGKEKIVHFVSAFTAVPRTLGCRGIKPLTFRIDRVCSCFCVFSFFVDKIWFTLFPIIRALGSERLGLI